MLRNINKMVDLVFIVTILEIVSYIEVLANDGPCQRYHVLDMHDGNRHIDYNPPFAPSPICDQDSYESDNWYRLILDSVNYELARECQPISACSTVYPVWMEGDYPTEEDITTTNNLCVNYAGNPCTCDSSFSDTHVRVRLCVDGQGGRFYIHNFDELPGCSLAFCVQDHPTGINEYGGDMIRCDVEDCTTVTIVYDEELPGNDVINNNFECVFTDENNEEYSVQSIWKTTTTLQCSLPTDDEGNTQYSLFVTDAGPEGDPVKTVSILIFNSTCQTCTENDCEFKDGWCSVNGGCGLCPPDETPTTTTERITTTTPGRTTTTPVEITDSSDDGVPILAIVIPVVILAVVIIAALVLVYWKHKTTETKIRGSAYAESHYSAPYYTSAPYVVPNPAYGNNHIVPPPPYNGNAKTISQVDKDSIYQSIDDKSTVGAPSVYSSKTYDVPSHGKEQEHPYRALTPVETHDQRFRQATIQNEYQQI